jgi:uncharacterized protein (DUF1810 family)
MKGRNTPSELVRLEVEILNDSIDAGNDKSMNDPYDLNRFVEAQAGNYETALAELRAGQKRTHWMWYVFPQIAGLGNSPMSVRYAIKTADEARAYLAHPVLGRRLIECAEAVLAVENKTATQIMGSPDDMKLRSCATLFDFVTQEDGSPYQRILHKYYGSDRDLRTLEKLAGK